MILIQNALVLTPSGEGKPLDVLIDKGTIADVAPRGSVKGEGMERVDAAGRALMPGLVNGHNHAQTGLAKGRFDRYNLETYLNAQPGATGRRRVEDKHLSALMAPPSWCARAAPRATTCSPSPAAHDGGRPGGGARMRMRACAPRSRR